VKPGSRLEQEEIFGPVLSVIRVASADEAFTVKTMCATDCRRRCIPATCRAFRALAELDNGITYINARRSVRRRICPSAV